MLGAFIGYTVAHVTGSFWLGLLLSPVLAGLIGTSFEMGLLRRLYRRDASAFLMVTFGLTLVMGEAIRLLWGVQGLQLPLPSMLAGIVFLFDEPFPVYRLFLIAAGAVLAVAIWQFLERTRLGLLIRATSQNAEMVHALGVDVNLVRSGIFGMGCGLAAFGGVLAAPLVTASLGMAANAIVNSFVIVIIGGMGSFPGSLCAAVLVAFVQVFGTYYFPDFAIAAMYLLMLLVLVIRPGGLLGQEA
jgi:branched-chain amino acid transport system permease protein